MEKRMSEDRILILFVDKSKKKRLQKGIAKGTYFHTQYENGQFAGWRTKEDISKNYPISS